MPTLTNKTSVTLGPYAKGAKLTISRIGPISNGVNNIKQLSAATLSDAKGSSMLITSVPKDITLSQGTTYTLTADAADVDYSVTTS